MTEKILTAPMNRASASPVSEMTYEEFLRWEGENQHVEWVNGRMVLMSPVSDEHSDVTVFLSALLRLFVEFHHLGRIFCEPFQMKTGPDLPGRAPDVLFVSAKNLSRLKRLHLNGPADLVVEVISPGSRAVDRGEKYYEYEQGGVREYWLIDTDREQAEFYQRNKSGIYQLAPTGAAGRYHSKVLDGLWLKVVWLWQRPLPPLLNVLKEWRII
jgi:Uma2 family endonuclease